MSSTTDQDRSQLIAELRAEEVTGLDQYEQRLTDNANEPANYGDFLLEGRAALMFSRHGFKVAIGERPDLQIELGKEIVHVEVKHFREKEQDRLDEEEMRETTDRLVRTGDLTQSEGVEAWQQITNVAIAKAAQYKKDAPNILVVESSSDSLVLMLGSAVRQYDDHVLKSDDLRLRWLSAMMLVHTRSTAFRGGQSNVEFCPTAQATVPLSNKLVSALWKIRIDLPK